MAGPYSVVAAKRRLSLDILAASKAGDNKIKVWTTQNSKKQNGISNTTDLRNHALSSDLPKSLYLRRKVKTNGLTKVKGDRKEKKLKPQTSEVRLSWRERLFTWRFYMVLLLQSSFVVSIFQRNCLPMAMVCMVKPRSPLSSSSLVNHSSLFNLTNKDNGNNTVIFRRQESMFENVSFHRNNTHWKDPKYEFDWNSEDQGIVLTSIMFSTFIGPMLLGVVKERLGSKLSLSICNLISSLMTFLSPMAARINPYCLVAVRIILGISLGANVPVAGDCVAWWAPQDEKLTMIALTFTGFNIGNVMASFLSGYLCLIPLDNGWPFVFYTFGSFSLLWGLSWHFLSSHKPEEHPYISEKEKQYIISHRVGMDVPPGGKQVKPPYRKLLTSVPVLAFLTSGTCHIWSTQVLFTYLPAFINKVMKFSVQETGLLISLTSLFRLFGSLCWTVIGNKLVQTVGIIRSRKLCIGLGFGLAGATAIIVGFFDESYRWVVLGLLIFVMLNQSVGSSTVAAVPLDMAPRYAGLLTGMSMSVGSLISISGPLLTAAVTTNGTHEEWRTVWIIMGSLFITGAAIFLLFGQPSLQPWAQGKSTDMPHVVSPFVTMGRRFSTFIEAPPLSPVSPMNKAFDFSQNVKAPSISILAHLASPSPDIYYAGDFAFGKTNIQVEIVDKSEEVSYEEVDDDTGHDDNSLEENIEEHSNRVRKRAFSEFGLEVLRSATLNANADINLHKEPNPFFEQIKTRGVSNISHAEAGSCNEDIAGTINEAFDDSVDEHVYHSGHIQSTRL